MANPTREQAIEACRKESAVRASVADRFDSNDAFVQSLALDRAATLLTRDGKLRERLEVLVEQWRSRVEAGSDAATWFMAAGELEAALKEGEK